jgi:aspartate aminotransferase
MVEPEGTFYLWGHWPAGRDPEKMVDALADRDVFVMPGSILNSPGYFRLSLTASDEMVDRALPIFEEIVR